MPALEIRLIGDGAFSDIDPGDIVAVDPNSTMRAALLEDGTETGDPSVAIGVWTEDGKVVIAQTTLKLFLTAADAFKARVGDPREAGG